MELFKSVSKLQGLDVVTGIPPTQRYSYLFDMNCQELDHMFVSQSLTKKAEFENVHVNTWLRLPGRSQIMIQALRDSTYAKSNVFTTENE
jgi:hypothetical protein